LPGAIVPHYPRGTLPLLPPQPDMRSAYESWSVDRFIGPFAWNDDLAFEHEVAPDEPANLGAKLNLWNDDPSAATEEELARAIFPRLRVIAQKTWESPPLVASYDEFLRIIDDVGRAP
jgi:hexosaminidase